VNVKEVKISELVIPDYCKREHPQEQVERFIQEFEVHGQYQPIVVSDNEILCGALIYTAMKQAGRETCFVNDLGYLPLEKKKEIRYLDNQIFDIEDWDEDAIKKFLMNLDVSKLEKFGFSAEEADLFINVEAEEIKVKNIASLNWIDQWECDHCGWKGTINE